MEIIFKIFSFLLFLCVGLIIYTTKNKLSCKKYVIGLIICYIICYITTPKKVEEIENKGVSAIKNDINEKDAVTKEENIIMSLSTSLGDLEPYKKEMTLNDGYTFNGYFLPKGKYKVTNYSGYAEQITIYKNEIHVTEEGYEEFILAEYEPILLNDKNETKLSSDYSNNGVFEIYDNEFIKIDDNSILAFDKIN